MDMAPHHCGLVLSPITDCSVRTLNKKGADFWQLHKSDRSYCTWKWRLHWPSGCSCCPQPRQAYRGTPRQTGGESGQIPVLWIQIHWIWIQNFGPIWIRGDVVGTVWGEVGRKCVAKEISRNFTFVLFAKFYISIFFSSCENVKNKIYK